MPSPSKIPTLLNVNPPLDITTSPPSRKVMIMLLLWQIMFCNTGEYMISNRQTSPSYIVRPSIHHTILGTEVHSINSGFYSHAKLIFPCFMHEKIFYTHYNDIFRFFLLVKKVFHFLHFMLRIRKRREYHKISNIW